MEDADGGFKCWTDGSFVKPEEGGVGYWLSGKEELVQYGLKYCQGFSPFHMEASTMLLAVQATRERNITNCQFFSDSEELCNILNCDTNPQTIDWRAHWKVQMSTHLRELSRGFTFTKLREWIIIRLII